MLGTTSSGISCQLRDNKVINMVKHAQEQFFINVNDILDNEGKSILYIFIFFNIHSQLYAKNESDL